MTFKLEKCYLCNIDIEQDESYVINREKKIFHMNCNLKTVANKMYLEEKMNNAIQLSKEVFEIELKSTIMKRFGIGKSDLKFFDNSKKNEIPKRIEIYYY